MERLQQCTTRSSRAVHSLELLSLFQVFSIFNNTSAADRVSASPLLAHHRATDRSGDWVSKQTNPKDTYTHTHTQIKH